MSKDKDNLRNIADARRKKMHVVEEPPVKPKSVIVDPAKDPVAKMALAILKIIGPYTDLNPVGVLAALQVVATTVGNELKGKYGHERTIKFVDVAQALAPQYKPEYRSEDGNECNATREEPMAGDIEEEPER